MNQVLEKEESVINLFEGFHTATFIVPNHKDKGGRYIICSASRDDEGYWVSDGTNVFDILYLPKTYGPDLELARKIVKEQNASNGILNKADFTEFLSINSDFKLWNLEEIIDINYGGIND